MHKIIIFLGPPGSGKGTQAKKVSSKFGYGHISTGDLLRALDADAGGDPDDKKMLAEMKTGKLVADTLIYKLAFAEINKYLERGLGVVLDGAIRNVEQASRYREFFISNNLEDEVVAIEIALTDEESFARLTRRRICTACGHTTYSTDTCPACGGPLAIRADDDPEIIKKRILEQGNATVAPIADYYDKLGILQKVDGMGTVEEVESEIAKLLNG